ncbi:hypothetical protein SCLCIDRAFT_1098476 [Scleroderma citrinum Foug A]|uniref:Uncharacterized protein n=1 Tax=Scleroderma citrinum Foug A TaxID=1036808 RepID=A0A0C2Z8B2_9AGAM|nr:hypothetical protein SCLCIDRAFT_1098476 [Scleroderma citrinum Foug A]
MLARRPRAETDSLAAQQSGSKRLYADWCEAVLTAITTVHVISDGVDGALRPTRPLLSDSTFNLGETRADTSTVLLGVTRPATKAHPNRPFRKLPKSCTVFLSHTPANHPNNHRRRPRRSSRLRVRSFIASMALKLNQFPRYNH